MEIFLIILTFIVLYLWYHATHIVVTKIRDVNGYEKFVLIVALGTVVLYVFGTT